ncbi:alpha/beta fold hydrolase [Streptomonospora litoralis]|uniref:2-hydroxymuconate semialdehyde hydrolase n=1 Tax=Streptomonospora litoralis TaxID=2498135 RepID=A0A4P6Q1W2_9ACTN|nr:alpha/beta hydrolase [Streptomonospora litoralis]QBI53231.1 2-hydroxymuconate semialdehyde hydrolase [Streptomonospora litoralis]
MTEYTLPAQVPLRYSAPDPAAAGVPVLLVHGFGSDFELNWVRTGWTRALAELPVFGCDLRGHGGSGKPHDPAAYTPARFTADLLGLLDALEIERVDVVGYSLGARLAWETALARPDRVRRGVLAGFGPRDAFAGTDSDDLDADESPFGAVYRAAAQLPGGDPAALAACARGQAAHPFSPEPAPEVPMLLMAGERDGLAAGMEDLARQVGGTALRAPGRDHRTAVSAQRLKKSAVEFLTAEPAALSRN